MEGGAGALSPRSPQNGHTRSGVRFLSFEQARIGKFAAEAACGPRGGQGKKSSLPGQIQE